MLVLLVILFTIKLYARINTFNTVDVESKNPLN